MLNLVQRLILSSVASGRGALVPFVRVWVLTWQTVSPHLAQRLKSLMVRLSCKGVRSAGALLPNLVRVKYSKNFPKCEKKIKNKNFRRFDKLKLKMKLKRYFP